MFRRTDSYSGLREICLSQRQTYSSTSTWSKLPAVTQYLKQVNLTKNEKLLAELKFSLVCNEMIYNTELRELLEILRESIKWNDTLPKFNRRQLIIQVTRLKKYSDHICHDLERDWDTEESIALNLSKVYDILDFNLNVNFSMTCQAYCEMLEETRLLLRKNLLKGSDKATPFSNRMTTERALIPLVRMSFLRSTLIKLLHEVPSLSEEAQLCRITLDNISSIIDQCYEILNSLHGSYYLADIDNMIELSLKFSSLNYKKQKTSDEDKAPCPDFVNIVDEIASSQECRERVENGSFTDSDFRDDDVFEEIPLRCDSPKKTSGSGDLLQKSFEESPLFQEFSPKNHEEAIQAFESDHVYELVEFTKNGCRILDRPLWCETDNVRFSGILETLTTQQKILQEAKFEVITSEVSYLKSLCVLMTLFYESPDLRDTLAPEEFEKLFSNISEVRKASEKFLHDLTGLLEKDPMMTLVCDIVRNHALSSFRSYYTYCTSQLNVHRYLERLMMENEVAFDIIQEIERSPECHGFSLLSFLTLPMQRVTRFPLLIQAIQKRLHVSSPEFHSCSLALAALNQLVFDCNETPKLPIITFFKKPNYKRLDKVSKLLNKPTKKVSAVRCTAKGEVIFI